MTTATITIHPGGAGSITLDGSASPISAAGVHAAQAVAMRQVKRHAERTGAPVHVQVTDPQGTSYLNVAADGTITRLTPPQSTDAEVDQDPAQEASTITPEADSQPTVLPPQPDEASTAVPSDAATDEVDADPRWADIAQQPATHGLRGTLNGMGLKLAPAKEELTERREALRQEIAREEETRRADEQLAQ